ncbi:MAG: hypothetical protein R3C15_04560 [Thermoleophilia bacterium]
MRRRIALACLVLAGALVAAADVGASIVPGAAIAGVRLGMPEARVRAVLGEPTREIRDTTELGDYVELRYPGLRIFLLPRVGVSSVATTRRAERTRSGVGVGSTVAAVRAGIPGIACQVSGGVGLCRVGGVRRGARGTDLSIRRGRVTEVSVYRVDSG